MAEFVKINEGVYRLEVPFPGCWTGVVLIDGVERILIDSGGCAETVDSCIVPALRGLGYELQDLSWLTFTHMHGDHVGGCGRMKELHPGLKIAIYEESLERMRDPRAYSAEIRARFPGRSAPVPDRLEGAEPERLLRDGEFLGDLQVIHTPGHDTDCCCFLERKTRTLITGDSLQMNGTVSQGCALLMDAASYGETLRRLRGMDIVNIVCGHPYLPLGAEAIGREASREYLAECAACHHHDAGFVAGMQAAGTEDAAEIARALIQDVGGKEPKFLFLPLYTVTEYMKRSETT